MYAHAQARHWLQAKVGVEKGPFCAAIGFALSVILFAVSYVSADQFANMPLAMSILVVNGALAIYGQLESITARSPLHYVSFLFCFIFMSAMPILQIGYKVDPIFSLRDIVLLTGVAGLSFTVFGLFSMKDLRRFAGVIQQVSKRDEGLENPRPNYVLLSGLLLTFCIATFAIFRQNLFTSREAFNVAIAGAFGDKTVGGALANFLMQAPFFGAVMGLRTALAKRHKYWVVTFVLLLLVSLVINNPLVSSRFKLAGLLFFFVDYFYRGRKIKLMIAFLILGISLAPMFQIFRHPNASFSETATYGNRYIATDYDAFQMAGYTLLTVDRNGLTWGSNLVGAALFWVPRSMWREKPEPSSFEIYYMARRYKEVGTNNLSVPLMIEGYYAFSWLGLCLISMLYWWGISRLYLRSLRDSDSLLFVLRCVVSGVVLIFLRGPLVTSVTAVAANCVAAGVAWRVFHEFKPRYVKMLTQRYPLKLPSTSSRGPSLLPPGAKILR